MSSFGFAHLLSYFSNRSFNSHKQLKNDMSADWNHWSWHASATFSMGDFKWLCLSWPFGSHSPTLTKGTANFSCWPQQILKILNFNPQGWWQHVRTQLTLEGWSATLASDGTLAYHEKMQWSSSIKDTPCTILSRVLLPEWPRQYQVSRTFVIHKANNVPRG